MIRAHHLARRFGSVHALTDFNLHVPEGSVVALLGPNGAGKSTALRILLNIVTASEGHAEIFGVDSRHLGPKELSRIGFVSESRELPDWMRVGDFFTYCRKFYPAWDERELSDLIRLLELPVTRPLRTLSRGTRMKAALAAALAYRPRLLILDEPFGGLDIVVRGQLLECLAERTPDCTILLATHDLSDIEGFATHVAYLSEGRILFFEEMDTLTARFREVEVLARHSSGLFKKPDSWLNLKESPGTFRFTHSDFDPRLSAEEIRAHWPDLEDLSIRALPLRSIFLALATSLATRRAS